MIALLQRVRYARVRVEGRVVARIRSGILVFAALEKTDDPNSCRRMAERILSYRLFSSQDTRHTQYSVVDTSGEVLLVPQFTLAANTRKGTRASFSSACPPAQAGPLFDGFVAACKKLYRKTAAGVFAADMQVELLNDGPVTFILRTPTT